MISTGELLSKRTVSNNLQLKEQKRPLCSTGFGISNDFNNKSEKQNSLINRRPDLGWKRTSKNRIDEKELWPKTSARLGT
jgi:hypothetical protein